MFPTKSVNLNWLRLLETEKKIWILYRLGSNLQYNHVSITPKTHSDACSSIRSLLCLPENTSPRWSLLVYLRIFKMQRLTKLKLNKDASTLYQVPLLSMSSVLPWRWPFFLCELMNFQKFKTLFAKSWVCVWRRDYYQMDTNPWDKAIGWDPAILKSCAPTMSDLTAFR